MAARFDQVRLSNDALCKQRNKKKKKTEKKSIKDREILENCSNPFFVPDRSEGCDLQGQVIRSEGWP